MRQLAAIMFVDMAGYTALMQENEQLAKAKQKHLKEVLDETVKNHHGKILQYYGDGSLSIFSSAVDSVSCAVEIQKQLQQLMLVLNLQWINCRIHPYWYDGYGYDNS